MASNRPPISSNRPWTHSNVIIAAPGSADVEIQTAWRCRVPETAARPRFERCSGFQASIFQAIKDSCGPPCRFMWSPLKEMPQNPRLLQFDCQSNRNPTSRSAGAAAAAAPTTCGQREAPGTASRRPAARCAGVSPQLRPTHRQNVSCPSPGSFIKSGYPGRPNSDPLWSSSGSGAAHGRRRRTSPAPTLQGTARPG